VTKHYDQAYFDRWYRDPRHRTLRAADLRRDVQLAVSLAEWVLQRPLRTVLDVGAGEGRWRAPLRALRPRVRYIGVEPSAWAVRRWGTRRDLRHGDLGTLHQLGLPGPFDLVVCADVLHYLSTPRLREGLQRLAPFVGGLAFCPTFTGADGVVGDLEAFQGHRRQATYRRAFAGAGLRQVGPHAWVPRDVAEGLAELESGPPDR
jgi:SAM-dependent methyltransferase